MSGLSLREAARETGRSKTALLRAIQAGRLSATRTDDGQWCIQPAELFRVYEARSAGTAPVSAEAGQDAPVKIATLETELKQLRERFEEMRQDRDRWHEQASRLALPAPHRRTWWPFRRSA